MTQWPWLSPTLQTLHILSIAAVIGSAGAINLRLAGLGNLQRPTALVARRFAPIIWGALLVMLLTGSVLIINRPGRYVRNWSFLTKIPLIVLACVILLFVQISLHRNPQFWESSSARRIAARVLGVATLSIWLTIIFAGRLIAYVY